MLVPLQIDSAVQIFSNNYLSILSFIGILITIILSGLSLSLQRRAAARESLEQLDDVQLRHTAKLRPLLHEYSWLRRKAVVKLKAYRSTDVAGVSDIHPRSLLLNCRGLQDSNVEPVSDGYHLTINSSNAVKIRRKTTQLLDNISKETRNRDDYCWVPFEDIEEHYGDAIRESEGAIHRDIRRILEERGGYSRQSEIEDDIADSLHSKTVRVGLRDLTMWDDIEEEKGEYRLKDD